MAYAVFGGADFGGGVWDLLAWGERKKRAATGGAAGNGTGLGGQPRLAHLRCRRALHLFSARLFRPDIALFIPFHLALLGIMLRGASFIFRSYQSRQKDAAAKTSAWGIVFGVASIISPILLGIAFGVVTEGGIRVEEGDVVLSPLSPGLSPYCIANGLLAVIRQVNSSHSSAGWTSRVMMLNNR